MVADLLSLVVQGTSTPAGSRFLPVSPASFVRWVQHRFSHFFLSPDGAACLPLLLILMNFPWNRSEPTPTVIALLSLFSQVFFCYEPWLISAPFAFKSPSRTLIISWRFSFVVYGVNLLPPESIFPAFWESLPCFYMPEKWLFPPFIHSPLS